jgi:hypothetical protein
MGLFGKKRGDGNPPGAPAGGKQPQPAPPAQQAPDWQQVARQGQELAAQARAGGLRRSFADLARYGQVVAQVGAQQVSTAQGGTGTAMQTGNVRGLLAALGMNWNSDYAKRCTCRTCGGPKRLPSPSAYLYCDYCGALADYDFRKACDSTALPGPAYVNLANSMRATTDAAKAAGDQAAYREAQRRLFEAYVTECPQAVSHRVGDAKYRAGLVNYMAETAVVNDFDPAFSALAAEVIEKVKVLQWKGGLQDRKVAGPSFRVMADVLKKQLARANELSSSPTLRDMDPDRAAKEVRDHMSSSTFCQGWLPFLEADDAKWLISDWGLDAEYTKLEVPTDGENWHCGRCGGDVVVLPGAKVVVCDHCGNSLDVGGGQSPCRGCGGLITFPVGLSQIDCPYCKTATERIGWT